MGEAKGPAIFNLKSNKRNRAILGFLPEVSGMDAAEADPSLIIFV